MKATWKCLRMLFAMIIGIGPLRDTATKLAAAPIEVASHDVTRRRPSPSGTAVWEPPNLDLSGPLPKPTIPKEMLSKVVVAGTSVYLEQTAIRDIAVHFGATVGHKGDAGDFIQWICFHGVDHGEDWVLWLRSGEINGGTVGSFQWQRIGNAAVLDQRCRLLSGRSVELQNHLGLGLAQADVLNDLGPATVWRADRAVYVHEHAESFRGEPYTSVNVVVVLFRRGEVQAIEVSKITSS